jgi:glutamine phosphoribosylpyrophosphate amidotransferase
MTASVSTPTRAGAGRRRVRRCAGDGHAARPPAVGHNRYATTGETLLRNVQPLYADFEFGGLAVAHNGNLTNATR